jgi:hypothetical protein
VWLYFRFHLSYRDVEEFMVARGSILTGVSCRPRGFLVAVITPAWRLITRLNGAQ